MPEKRLYVYILRRLVETAWYLRKWEAKAALLIYDMPLQSGSVNFLLLCVSGMATPSIIYLLCNIQINNMPNVNDSLTVMVKEWRTLPIGIVQARYLLLCVLHLMMMVITPGGNLCVWWWVGLWWHVYSLWPKYYSNLLLNRWWCVTFQLFWKHYYSLPVLPSHPCFSLVW